MERRETDRTEGNSFLGMSDAFGLDGPNVRGSPKDSWLQNDSLDKAPQQAVRAKCCVPKKS